MHYIPLFYICSIRLLVHHCNLSCAPLSILPCILLGYCSLSFPPINQILAITFRSLHPSITAAAAATAKPTAATATAATATATATTATTAATTTAATAAAAAAAAAAEPAARQ
jgi:hypothetical protein